MAPRGSGSRDRSSSAGASAAPGPVRATPRRRRRLFRRSEPIEDVRTAVPGADGDGGAQPPATAVPTAAVAAAVQALGQPKPGPVREPDPHADLLANVALRDLTLVESLLALVEEAERDEQDPDRLAFLFRLDHLATRLRRSSENLLVLAGRDAPDGPDEPVPLLEVVRAAISESADYARVDIGRLPPVAIGPHAADDLSHLLAELLDNALAMSPAHTTVTVTGSGASNTVLVAVDDDGIGLPVQRLAEYNSRLAAPPTLDAAAARQMGLYVVASLAHRHGVYVQMQARPGGGTSVVAALPLSVLAALPAPPPSNAVPVAVGMAPAATGAYVSATAVRDSALTPLAQAPVGPRPWVGEASVGIGAGGTGGVRGGAGVGDLRTAAPVANAWTPDPAPVSEPTAGAATGPAAGSASAPAAGPGFGPAPDSSGEEPRNTPSGLPRRTRPTGWADPPPPVPDITPADPQSVFDDLAAFDAGQRAAADAPAWEGPWES